MAKQAVLKIIRWCYHKVFHEENGSWEKFQKYIKMDSSVVIGSGVTVSISNPPSENRCLLEIEKESYIYGPIIILRPEAKISIGQRCQLGCTLVSAIGIEIGDDVLVAGGTVIWDNDSHSVVWEERMHDVPQFRMDMKQDPDDCNRNKDWTHVKMRLVTIHDKVWIGMNVTILKGVTIGEGAVVGAMSVVTHDVPPYTIVAGNPARIIHTIGDLKTKSEKD